MSKSLVITFIGEDRPGIVEGISSIINDFQGEWVESRLANLSGKFTGILSVNFPESNIQKAMACLKNNPIDGISLQVEEVSAHISDSQGECVSFEIIGHDKPGIVHSVSALLMANNATINSLESEIFDAPMTGEKLFQSDITICLVDMSKLDKLCEDLEKLGIELVINSDNEDDMVD